MERFVAVALALAFAATPLAGRAADSASLRQRLMGKLHWRSIGPYIGGRSVAVAGVPSTPNLFYMGGVEGGVWKSTNYGLSWTNITDGKIPGIADPIGALAVAPSNSNVIYAGTGEADIRSDFDTGDGVYKTTDAGKTWSYAGLRDTHMIAKLAIDPGNPNVVYAASMGHVFKPNSERGIFKTTDGGATWRKVLFVDANTGGIDLAMDSRNRNVLYAAMWQAQRVPWKLTSGGPGSGLYKTLDGGAHWTKISSNPGFATGTLGKIGVSVAASNPRIVYAIVQAKDGGVFRSNDAGATWKRVNGEMKLRQRAFYYTAIFADPTNPEVAYVPNVDALFKTKDGGKTFTELSPPHGDNHIVWINPRNPKILLEGNDGGGTVSVDGGDTWSSERNQPTGQFYHVALDDQFPFHVFGASQDEGAFEGPSAAVGPGIGPGDWHNVALGESTFVAPEPGSPFVTYGSGYFSAFARFDRITGDLKNVSPWPRYMSGATAAETQYRFGWTHPIFFSPADPRELLVAAQVVFSSLDHGNTWSIISPDLTRNDPSTEGPTGGPVDADQTGAETFPDIASLAVSPLDAGVLWAGSADGLVHVTTDHGAHWTLVTPPQLPQWAQISSIEPSHAEKDTAYRDRVALHVGRLPSLRLRNDRLRRALDGDVRRHSQRSVRLRRASGSARAAPVVRRHAQHRLRQPRRRRPLAAAHAQSPRRPGARPRNRRPRRRARRRDPRPRVLDPRQPRAARTARAPRDVLGRRGGSCSHPSPRGSRTHTAARTSAFPSSATTRRTEPRCSSICRPATTARRRSRSRSPTRTARPCAPSRSTSRASIPRS